VVKLKHFGHLLTSVMALIASINSLVFSEDTLSR